MKQLLTLAALILLAFNLSGQIAETTTNKPYIEVTGTAELNEIPDEIFISFSLRERIISKDRISIEEQEVRLIAGLESIGIAKSELFLSDANAGYLKIRWRPRDVLTKKDYSLKVSDAETVSRVFEKLDSLEIYDARIERVYHSRMDSLRKEVKIMAIVAAREKATYLLQAIDQQVGKPLVVTEQVHPDHIPMGSRMTSNVLRSAESQLDETEPEIQFEKIRLRASIYVRFEIK